MVFSGSDRFDATQGTLPNPSDRSVGKEMVVVRDQHAGQSGSAPSVLSSVPTVAALLLALRRRWFLALSLGFVLASATMAGVWFVLPEKFTARTLVHIPAFRPVILGETAESRTEFSSFQRTQLAYIKSRLVLNAALRDPKVAELKLVRDQSDPLTWLEKQVQADFSTGPEILRIQITGEEATGLVALVNAVRECYFKEVRGREIGWRENRLKLLKDIYADADRKLGEKRRMLTQMSQDLGSTKDPKVMERAQETYWKALDLVQSELLQVQAKLRQAKMEFEIEKAREAKNEEVALPPALVDDAIKKDAQVAAYEKQVAGLDSKIELLRKNAKDPENEPNIKKWEILRNLAQADLAKLREALRLELAKKMKEKVAGDRESFKLARQQEIGILEQQHQWLDDEFNTRLKSFQGLNKKRIDVEWLRDEIALEDDLAKRMATQSQHLQIEMKAPERFNTLEEAFFTPDQDSRLKKAGMAGGGAFLLVALAISFLEFRSRRVNSVDEVVRGLRMRFVGSLPPLPTRAPNRSSTKHGNSRWQTQMNESIESARTMLLHAAQRDGLKLIVVTSAVGGEGKTLTSSHLAASLARAGRKTLLIDADLRRPSLQKLFDLVVSPGFGELLRGEADLSTVIQEGPVPGLAIISAGLNDDRSIQALSQPILAELFASFREKYDFVVVDSAPILPIADSQMICQQADGTIFSILRHVSRLPQIYAAHERLAALRIRVIGAMVSGTEGPLYGSTYPYGRGAASTNG